MAFLFWRYVEQMTKASDPSSTFCVFWTPDKRIGELVGDMFGVLRIHTRRYNGCSNIYEVLVGAAASPIFQVGDAAALPQKIMSLPCDADCVPLRSGFWPQAVSGNRRPRKFSRCI